jgi:hypothetical protein
MAGEFKIKTGLILGATPTVPVFSIQNASTSIVIDASDILVTAKAIYDFVNSRVSPNTLAGLSDVSIVNASDFNMIRYDYASGKWKNIAPTEASLYFWELSTPLLRESSIGSGLVWSGGMLNVSVGIADYATTVYVNNITNPLIIQQGNQDTSVYNMGVYIDGSLALRDVSILWLQDNKANLSDLAGFITASYVTNALLPYATNSSISTADFAKNASLGIYATNVSVGLAIAPFATNASVGLALGPYATNASVNAAFLTTNASFGAYATNASVGTALGAYATNASISTAAFAKAYGGFTPLGTNTSYLVSASDNNGFITADVSATTIVFPNTLTNGFSTVVINDTNGPITLNASTLLSQDSSIVLRNKYAAATVICKSAGVFYAFGNLK